MNKQQLLSTPVRHKSLCVLPAGQSFVPLSSSSVQSPKQKTVSYRMIVAVFNPVICPYASILPRPPSQQWPIST